MITYTADLNGRAVPGCPDGETGFPGLCLEGIPEAVSVWQAGSACRAAAGRCTHAHTFSCCGFWVVSGLNSCSLPGSWQGMQVPSSLATNVVTCSSGLFHLSQSWSRAVFPPRTRVFLLNTQMFHCGLSAEGILPEILVGGCSTCQEPQK